MAKAFQRFSRRALIERCAVLEQHVSHQKFATDDELTSYRPGGTENPSKAMDGWVFWHAQLVRFCGREELREHSDDATDAVIMEALSAAPVSIRLAMVDESGQPRYVNVYPKSLEALFALRDRDWLIGWMAEKIHAVAHLELTEDRLQLHGRALREMAYEYQVLCWIVTHAEAGLPFSGDVDRPEIPEDRAWLRDIEPQDVIRICQAHGVVNASRLHALTRLIALTSTPEDDTTRPSWPTFVGSLAMKLSAVPTQLVGDQSLVELLSMVQVHGAAEHAAHERARKEAERERFEQGH